jgi:fibro-slime domain-containing protein
VVSANSSSAFTLTVIALGGLVGAHAAASTPTDYQVHGKLRDFRAVHPDFEVTPSAGVGLYAETVADDLGANGLPVMGTSGRKVTQQWRDADGRAIPPSLYLGSGGGPGDGIVYVEYSPSTSNNPTIDTFNSGAGPYGGANVGPAPTWQAGSDIPDISPPSGLPYTDKYERAGGTHVLSSSFSCKEFIIKDYATLRISGDVVVRANEKIDIINQCEIELLDGASFELWGGKDVQITDESQVNVNTADPSRFRFFYFGSTGNTLKIQNNSDVYGTVLSPNHDMLLQDSGELFGKFTGRRLSLQNSSGYHHDSGSGAAATVCGAPVSDTSGQLGVSSSGGITSALSFAQWFRDVPGVNLTGYHSITLTRNGAGVYEHLDDEFHPADDRMLGNEESEHNRYFTYEVNAEFTSESCTDQFIEFQGGDGVWIFIDDALVLDLGGAGTNDTQYVQLDRLGLSDGVHSLKLLYAQRRSDSSMFRLRTNLVLLTSRVQTVNVMAD